jgi:Holliday junction DNA helicase RuvA
MNPGEIASAVGSENDGAFRKVSGIGPKTAKLIVLSLAGKMQAFTVAASPARHGTTSTADSVLVALVGLGWSERVAADAVDDAVANSTDADVSTVPALLRVALSRLGPRGSGVGGGS